MSKIKIIGAGLIGLYIANYIKKNSFLQNNLGEIEVHDQSKSIIAAWNEKSHGHQKVNNGFHGIEYPRAAIIRNYLSENGCEKLITEIPNKKILWIENHKINFNSSSKQWPSELTRGLDPLIQEDELLKDTVKLRDAIVKSTNIGEIIERCHKRFGDELEKSWHLFYPWFLPAEFSFPNNDEGDNFRNSVRNNKIKSSYIVPAKGTFSGLKSTIKRSAERRGIEFMLGSRLSREEVERRTKGENTKIIWCASSIGLIHMIDKSLAKRCISSTRHLHLAICSITRFQVEKLREELGYIPTEILCLNSKVPELNRISFADYAMTANSKSRGEIIMMAEYITDKETIEEKETEKIRACIEKYLTGDIRLVTNIYGRKIYSLEDEEVDKATNLIKQFAEDRDIQIPEIYYGPINMAKCGIIARDFCLVNYS